MRSHSLKLVYFLYPLVVLIAFIGLTGLTPGPFLGTAYALSPQGFVEVSIANPSLPPIALKTAKLFLDKNPNLFKNKEYLTIVNFDQPSTEQRLYLVDLKTGITETSLVSHGRNSSDPTDKKMATHFSNTWGSFQSSLGFFKTLGKNDQVSIQNPDGHYQSTGLYQGASGRSLRIVGLEPRNSEALNREIVIHSDRRVSGQYIAANGFLWASLGCPSLEPAKRDRFIDLIEGQSLFYIFKSDHSL